MNSCNCTTGTLETEHTSSPKASLMPPSRHCPPSQVFPLSRLRKHRCFPAPGFELYINVIFIKQMVCYKIFIKPVVCIFHFCFCLASLILMFRAALFMICRKGPTKQMPMKNRMVKYIGVEYYTKKICWQTCTRLSLLENGLLGCIVGICL